VPPCLRGPWSLGFFTALMTTAAAAALFAQAPASPPGAPPPGDVVVGSGNYSPVVHDLDRAIAFYGGLLGLTVPPPAAPGPRPFSPDPAIHAMFGMPDAQLRWVTARVPGSPMGIEMVEASGIARTAAHPRPYDPGSTTLVLLVRDIDKAFAPLKAAGVQVITPGGVPIAIRPGAAGSTQARGVIVADPDGHFVELLQPAPLPDTTAPADSNIVGARVRLAVADTARAARVYRDQLQMQPQIGDPGAGPLLDLMGLKRGKVRLTTVDVPGSTLKLELVEVSGVSRTPMRARLQDPGATRLQVRVKDIDATIAALKAGGSSVVSTGGVPVTLQGGVRAAIMPDADGLFFVLIQAAPRPQ
jgi:catechol 2,3-dioxygenase-like lactoylglutathione lyase family enzyme